jgi:hypothetical protein
MPLSTMFQLYRDGRSGQVVQHYVIKFISDLRQVGGFLWILRFPPPIKLDCIGSCRLLPDIKVP